MSRWPTFLTHPKNLPPTGFVVDEVEPANSPLETQSMLQSITHRFQRRVLLVPEPERKVLKGTGKCHPLIMAVHRAFAQHYPLTLSPDMIWLVISQGFSHHIASNPEHFRSRLVQHEGTRELTATISGLGLGDFRNAMASFSDQIREASDPVLHETLICDFSTTTPDIRTASEVVLMDTYASYFSYAFDCVCGIPRIKLMGSIEDWQRIRARVEVLETYELSWWVTRLRPILDELVQTAKGEPNQSFWQAIYKPLNAYATYAVTGWIADLFPYLNDPPDRRKNDVLDQARSNWALPVEKGVSMFNSSGTSMYSFPSGLASVPCRLTSSTRPDQPEEKIDLVGGFLAVEQSTNDLSLSPLIGWSATVRAPDIPVLAWRGL